MTEPSIEQECQGFKAAIEELSNYEESDYKTFCGDEDIDFAFNVWLAAKRAAMESTPSDDANEAIRKLSHEMDAAAQHITERQVYDFADQIRVLLGLDGKQAVIDAMGSVPTESEKGDIVGWLRRRAGNDLVMIPGRLAGEIADHIEKLAAPVSAEPVAWYSPASGGFWLSEGSIPTHIKALGVEVLGKIAPPVPVNAPISPTIRTLIEEGQEEDGDELIPPNSGELKASEEDSKLALDLLATIFEAYENGISCCEMSGDEEGECLGNAVRLDYETSTKCADLLNRLRPKITAKENEDGDERCEQNQRCPYD